jgi:hypothetical protein
MLRVWSFVKLSNCSSGKLFTWSFSRLVNARKVGAGRETVHWSWRSWTREETADGRSRLVVRPITRLSKLVKRLKVCAEIEREFTFRRWRLVNLWRKLSEIQHKCTNF